ncbi:MAG: bifunctional 4-hydroxy-2-oxoglutarate aldolase/2-dehydro-3-deoxy-phosphogluconate aldolase [Candidatus Promineifilaceae bacterium]|nr:bifunctional 4-hydroxy-2-oxoglutarate aldolase/2-dehydro-3-deoxy-phosphogluconate aldolase [Candidatus Promineifilaceae bacterium]
MAKYRRLEVLNGIVDSGLVPIFYHEAVSVAGQIVDACATGGARAVEFTNRGDGAWQVFTTLLEHRRRSQTEIMLGAGSIVDAPTASLYVNSGADFIVGPAFDGEIAALCNRRKVAYIPGCATLTEIGNAEAAGVELVKIFPGQLLGPEFVRAVRGPQPWTNMLVTGGVRPDAASLQAWFEAGATAVGIGSGLIRRDWVTAGQFDKITQAVAQTCAWINRHRAHHE